MADEDFVKGVMQIQSVEATTAKYDKWNKYDEEMVECSYNGPRHAAEAFDRLGLSKTSAILEVGAGTGLFGRELRRRGYQHLVALEPSDMINQAKTAGIYDSYIKDYVKKGRKLDIPKEHFDVVALCGVIGPGHMHLEDLIELIPAVKKGGLICWAEAGKDFFAEIDSRYKYSVRQEVVQGYVTDGLLRVYNDPLTLPDFFQGHDGLFNVMQVL